jgi:hypothetical protein
MFGLMNPVGIQRIPIAAPPNAFFLRNLIPASYIKG